jgi:hypothetical protein
VDEKQAPDTTVTALQMASEVVAVFRALRQVDLDPDSVKHLWSLAHSIAYETWIEQVHHIARSKQA